MTEIAITAFLRLCFTLTRKAVEGVPDYRRNSYAYPYL